MRFAEKALDTPPKIRYNIIVPNESAWTPRKDYFLYEGLKQVAYIIPGLLVIPSL